MDKPLKYDTEFLKNQVVKWYKQNDPLTESFKNMWNNALSFMMLHVW